MITEPGYSMLKEFPSEFSKSISLPLNIIINHPVKKIVIAGMGGSSYPGSICKTYLEDLSFSIPIEVCRKYSLTGRNDETTLVLVSSYSGNTDEAIACYFDALQRRCQTVIITSGGRLLELSMQNSTPLVIIDHNVTDYPSAYTGFFVGIILSILEDAGLQDGLISEVGSIEEFLWRLEVREEAESIAKRIANRIPIIYTSAKFEESIARIAKLRLNELAKTPAFYNVFPQLTHYELMGFEQKWDDFHFVLIEDPDESIQIKAHISAFEQVFIRRKNIPLTTITMRGESMLKKIVGSIYLFEWVALYLAGIRGTDPFSESLGKELKQFISQRDS